MSTPLPPTEEASLRDLYRRTHEAHEPASEVCSWPGVTCAGGHITRVNWSAHHLPGTLPPDVRFLTHLTALDLSRNQLHGPLPPELGHLKQLRTLNLAGNQFGGTLPPRLRLLLKLRVLDLHGNQLTGSLPSGWGDLRALETLNLADNRLQGNVPESWGNLASLDTLDLSGNPLRGTLPASLIRLTSLRTFHFQGTELGERGDSAFQAWLRHVPDVRPSGLITMSAPATPHKGRRAALLGVGALGTGLTLAGVLLLPLGLIPGLLLAGGGATAIGWAVSRWRLSPPTQPALPGDTLAAQLLREAHELQRRAQDELPPEQAAQVTRLVSALEELLPRFPHLPSGEPDAYTLRQIVRSYLPEAINHYRALPPEYARRQPLREGQTAQQLLQTQLDTLIHAVEAIAARTLPDARPLLVHGRFLEDRFAGEENPKS